jgi:hypothetical protein
MIKETNKINKFLRNLTKHIQCNSLKKGYYKKYYLCPLYFDSLCVSVMLLGTFIKVQKAASSFSVHLHLTAVLPVDRF